jgi:hypothetical protein
VLNLARKWAKFRAMSGGYFWLPCPLCGTEFGGQEWRKIDGHFDSIPVGEGWGSATAICPTCTAAGHGCTAHAVRGTYHLPCAFVRSPIGGNLNA